MKYITLLLVVIFCHGCATPPSYFIVNTISDTSNSLLSNNLVNVEVTDLRSRQDILQSNHNGSISYLSAQLPTTVLIKQGLINSFNQKSKTMNNSFNTNVIHVDIEKMAMKLTQSSFSYETKSLIKLTVTFTNQNKTLKKTFKRQGASKGPLKADIAVMEQDFNQLLTLIFNDISQDSELINYLTL